MGTESLATGKFRGWPAVRHNGELYVSQEAFENALEEIDKLKRAIWKFIGALGFDQDGAEYWHLTHPDLITYAMQCVEEFRADYDKAIEG